MPVLCGCVSFREAILRFPGAITSQGVGVVLHRLLPDPVTVSSVVPAIP